MADDKKIIKKPISDADAAGGSLAYMPGAEGDDKADKPSISIEKGERDDDQKTMADIATELSQEDDKKAVKIGVNGKAKPKKVSQEEALDAFPEEVGTPEELPELDKEPELSHDDIESMKTVMEEPEVQRAARTKGRKLLVFLLLILLVASGVFGWLWWTARSDQADLNAKITELEAAAKGTTQTATTTGTSAVRSIPELSLTYKLDDATNKLTYRYRESVDADKKVHRVLTFSSTDIISAERAISNAAPKCTAEFSPLGLVSEYVTGDTYKGTKIETQKVDDTSLFKVGDNYYVYETPQTACSADKTVQAAVTTAKSNLAEMLKTLAEAK